MDIDTITRDLERRLRAAGSTDRAENEKRYLKSELEFWGVPMPAIRRAVTDAVGAITGLSGSRVTGLVTALWAQPVHEMRMAAVELTCSFADRLEPADIDMIEQMLRQAKTWAYVDALAVHAAGPLLDRHPEGNDLLDRWSADDDFWIRRSALLAHLARLRGGGGDWERFARYADAMLDEKEFFIRKAIGWVLRDTARLRPQLVFDWILPRARRASGVTIREAVKRLPPHQAEQVMARHRDRKVPDGRSPADGT